MVWLGVAATAGRTLLGKVGLNPATLSKAGGWLKSALTNPAVNATTSVAGAGTAVVRGRSVAQASNAAQQVNRHRD